MAYLALMIVLVSLGCLAVWLKERHPARTNDSVTDFRRGLDALAPRSEKGT